MILMTQSELLELVEELRSMALAHRDALNQLADRYAARIHRRHEAFSKMATIMSYHVGAGT